ncbi:MAG: GNAT family N-acetyltransferase [Paracoccaceae bacterium]|nr:GNAT family N-acetyltransferase [Paracoccaceae bacterium]MDG2260533.1 GNAT family N-acetyltransferase [Paracoccaceae bacterium]
MPMLCIDEIMALDLLTLNDHTSGHPRPLDPINHFTALDEVFNISSHAEVRRNGLLVAYVQLRPQSPLVWFVGGAGVHPDYRNPSVFRELLKAFSELITSENISHLKSNVFKANTASIRLHKHLGFQITRESKIGYEFSLDDTAGLSQLTQVHFL